MLHLQQYGAVYSSHFQHELESYSDAILSQYFFFTIL